MNGSPSDLRLISVCGLDLWKWSRLLMLSSTRLGAEPAPVSCDHAPAQLQGHARTRRMNPLTRFAAGAPERSSQMWRPGGAVGDRGLWGSSAPARLWGQQRPGAPEASEQQEEVIVLRELNSFFSSFQVFQEPRSGHQGHQGRLVCRSLPAPVNVRFIGRDHHPKTHTKTKESCVSS